MDDFFKKERCDRCGGSLKNGRIMSIFNEDCICMKCKKEERKHADYLAACAAERAELKKGNRNFAGIGYRKEGEARG